MNMGHDAGRVPNITERGRARRRTGGVVWSVVALAAAAWVLFAHRDGWWCAAVGVPVAMSALGFLQARERT